MACGTVYFTQWSVKLKTLQKFLYNILYHSPLPQGLPTKPAGSAWLSSKSCGLTETLDRDESQASTLITLKKSEFVVPKSEVVPIKLRGQHTTTRIITNMWYSSCENSLKHVQQQVLQKLIAYYLKKIWFLIY